MRGKRRSWRCLARCRYCCLPPTARPIVATTVTKRKTNTRPHLPDYWPSEPGAYLLYTWAFSESDPNWDQHSPYKEVLRRMVYDHAIRFVIDLHGMSNRHAFGIAVGTMQGRSCPKHETLLLTTLQQRGYQPTTVAEIQAFGNRQWDRYVLNHRRFTGGLTSHTVTRFAHEELRIAAVQIELCASLRIARRRPEARRSADFIGDPVAIAHAIETFDLVIRRLASSFD